MEWRSQVSFSCFGLDLALLEDKLATIIDSSSEEEMLYNIQWEGSNKLSLMFLQMITANNIKTTISKTKSAKNYIMFVEEHFNSADKSLASTLMTQLMTMKYDGSRGV